MNLGLLTNGRFSLREKNIFHMVEVEGIEVDIRGLDVLDPRVKEEEILLVDLIVEDVQVVSKVVFLD